MTALIRFFFGAAIGSFLDVVALRYDPDRFLFSRASIGGRSRCPSCRKVLGWHELIPIVSFLLQRGRCRSCKAQIAIEHFWAEIVSGLIFMYVPIVVRATAISWYPLRYLWAAEALWVALLLALLLITLIDIRLYLIPDEASIAIGAAGIALAYLGAHAFGPGTSFLGHYAFLFGFRGDMAVNRLIGAAAAAALFGFLVFVTKGKGMGMGDLKLAAALGIAFGWPDALISFAFAFVLGSLFGIWHIVRGKGSMKSAVPFGPFLALGASAVFFFGEPLARAYFSLVPIL